MIPKMLRPFVVKVSVLGYFPLLDIRGEHSLICRAGIEILLIFIIVYVIHYTV